MKFLKVLCRNRPLYPVCFCSSILFYFVNRFYLKFVTTGIIQRICKCYLSDFLAPLCLLSVLEAVLYLIDKEIRKIGWILAITLLLAVFWEVIGPYINSRLVFDWFDFMAYIAGGMFFYFLLYFVVRDKTG